MNSKSANEIPSAPSSEEPERRRLPATPATSNDTGALRRLEVFHRLSATSDGALAERRPASLADAEPSGGRVAPVDAYPLFFSPAETGEGAFGLPLRDVLATALVGLPAAAAELLRGALDELVAQARRLGATHAVPLDARRLVEAAGRELRAARGEEGDTPLGEAIERLAASIPASGRALPAGPQAPLHLLAEAGRRRTFPARAAFLEEARALRERAAQLLEVGERGAATGSLGALGGRFVDASALAAARDLRGGREPIAAARREGIEAALAVLDAFLDEEHPPPLWLAHDGLHPVPGIDALAGEPENWRVVVRENPCAAAVEIFDRQSEGLVHLLRALARLDLETTGVYDPERHAERLNSLCWDDLQREERDLLPLVIALTSAEQIANRGMAALSRLMRSGRPVQVLLTAEPLVPMEGEPAEMRFEPLLFGLGHRRAVLQQSAMVRPRHLLRGFVRALETCRPGMHIVSLDDARRVDAAIAGRAHPLAFHDPDAGRSWAARLDLGDNPAAEADWSRRVLPVSDADGSAAELEVAVTFIDAALLEPSWSSHLAPIPESVGEDALVPIEEAVARFDERGGIPFVWTLDAAGELARLAISRQLLVACRERLEIWRALQEMAGLRPRLPRPRRSALLDEERDRLRREVAEEITDRLTTALFDDETADWLVADAPQGDGSAAAPPTLPVGDAGSIAESLRRLIAAPATSTQPLADGARVREVADALRRLLGAGAPPIAEL